VCSGGWPLNTNTRILAKFRKKSNETCNFNLKKTAAKKKLTVLQIWVLKASVVCEQRSTNVHEKSGSTKKTKNIQFKAVVTNLSRTKMSSSAQCKGKQTNVYI